MELCFHLVQAQGQIIAKKIKTQHSIFHLALHIPTKARLNCNWKNWQQTNELLKYYSY